MPGGDATGPLGLGPMTGRAAGYCAGYAVPGYMNPIPGRGLWGAGRAWFGRGRGWRNRYYATGLPGRARAVYGYPGDSAFGVGPYPYAPEVTPKEELGMLQDQAGFLKKQLEDIQQHISTLEKVQAQETG